MWRAEQYLKLFSFLLCISAIAVIPYSLIKLKSFPGKSDELFIPLIVAYVVGAVFCFLLLILLYKQAVKGSSGLLVLFLVYNVFTAVVNSGAIDSSRLFIWQIAPGAVSTPIKILNDSLSAAFSVTVLVLTLILHRKRRIPPVPQDDPKRLPLSIQKQKSTPRLNVDGKTASLVLMSQSHQNTSKSSSSSRRPTATHTLLAHMNIPMTPKRDSFSPNTEDTASLVSNRDPHSTKRPQSTIISLGPGVTEIEDDFNSEPIVFPEQSRSNSVSSSIMDIPTRKNKPFISTTELAARNHLRLSNANLADKAYHA